MPKPISHMSIVFVLSLTLSFVPAAPGQEAGSFAFDPFGQGSGSDGGSQVQSVISDDKGPIIPKIAFDNTEISAVFRIISDATGWSIFPTADVSKAKISLWANDITAKDMLETVVELAGFTYHREGSLITVMTYDEYTQFFGLAKKVVTLQYARAESIVRVLEAFKTKLSKSVVHAETNTIVLFDSEANLETMTNVIEKLDVPSESETVLEVIDLEYMDVEVLAETLQKVFADAVPEKDIRNMQNKLRESPSPTTERITGSPEAETGTLFVPQSQVRV